MSAKGTTDSWRSHNAAESLGWQIDIADTVINGPGAPALDLLPPVVRRRHPFVR